MNTMHAMQAPVHSGDRVFAFSILAGLMARRKTIDCKWLYDAEGSRLFDAITDLDDYYPTRTEFAILRDRAAELQTLAAPGCALVELGSGSSVKTRLLLNALPCVGTYVPVDISDGHLERAASRLDAEYPAVKVHPLVADFTAEFSLPASLETVPKILFFPGSTIGNFEVRAAGDLLARLRSIANVSAFVIGADLKKDAATLVRAYDDSEGVTAAFNLNLLTRINRELGADFDPGAFRHEARWNAMKSRVEMHLVSRCVQYVHLLGERIVFEEGETIHTENSHKYDLEQFEALAADAGWNTHRTWIDDAGLFCVAVLTPAAIPEANLAGGPGRRTGDVVPLID